MEPIYKTSVDLQPRYIDTYNFVCLVCFKQKTSKYRICQTTCPKFCSQECRKNFLIKENEDNPRKCKSCKITKRKKDFRRITCKDGTSQNYKNCLDCEKKQKEKISIVKKYGIPYDVYHQGLSPQNFLKYSLKNARRTAKATGKDFSINYEYLISLWEKQKGLCAISKIPMTYFTGKGRNVNYYNVSLDRIDSEKGYIRGNVQLTCYIVNIMKNRLVQKEFLQICRKITGVWYGNMETNN